MRTWVISPASACSCVRARRPAEIVELSLECLANVCQTSIQHGVARASADNGDLFVAYHHFAGPVEGPAADVEHSAVGGLVDARRQVGRTAAKVGLNFRTTADVW